jgi:hypothetical protein
VSDPSSETRQLDKWDVLLTVASIGLAFAAQLKLGPEQPWLVVIAPFAWVLIVARHGGGASGEQRHAEVLGWRALLGLFLIATGVFIGFIAGLLELVLVAEARKAPDLWFVVLFPVPLFAAGAGLCLLGARVRSPKARGPQPENVIPTPKPPGRRELGE